MEIIIIIAALLTIGFGRWLNGIMFYCSLHFFCILLSAILFPSSCVSVHVSIGFARDQHHHYSTSLEFNKFFMYRLIIPSKFMGNLLKICIYILFTSLLFRSSFFPFLVPFLRLPVHSFNPFRIMQCFFFFILRTLDFYLWKSGCYVKSIKSNWHASEDGRAIGCVWKVPHYCFIHAIRERVEPSIQRQSIWLLSMAPLCSQYPSIRNATTYSVWALHSAMRTCFRRHAR